MVLREYMFDNLYTNPVVKGEESKAEEIICLLYKYFMENPDELPLEFKEKIEQQQKDWKSNLLNRFTHDDSGTTDAPAVDAPAKD